MIAIFFCVLFYFLYRIVVWARRRAKRAYIIGAALAPFMALGNVADPDFRILQEAKRLKNREDDDPGDPPDPDDDELVLAAASAVAERQAQVVRHDAVVTARVAPPRIRPALVWVVSIALGLSAGLTSLILSWILLSDPSFLPLQARFVRGSLSVLDWAPLYLMSATLLTSMVMLFRLHKSSVWMFAAYVAVGVLLTVLWVEPKPYFDLRVTMFGGMPVAIAVLAYMLRLQKRAILA
jgi:hypothetical protein